jgi:hypothetical protein
MATRKKPVMSAQNKRTTGQFIAAVAAGFLPVASYIIAHHEMQDNKWLAGLVVAALLFSAPTLAEWAQKWCKSPWKAWGFTVLLEGVMVLSSIPALSLSALGILAAINCHSAWIAAAVRPRTVRTVSAAKK